MTVTLLCVSLDETTTEGMLGAMRRLPPEVDVVELRLDAMAACDIDRLLAGRDRPVIATNRPTREGGACEAPEEQRLALLRRAAELGAEFVDVESDSSGALGPLPGECRRIVSMHDFDGTPPDLDRVVRLLVDAGADVAKLAVMPGGVADVGRVLRLLEDNAAGVPTIALSMGEEGVPTRVLAPKLGAFLTFASTAPGSETGPGQVPLRTMLEQYRAKRIGPATAVYGVVANPVGHSLSPVVHNAAFAALDLDAVYLPFKVDDCRAFFQAFEPLDLRGISVTIPHKETMLPLMHEASELAAEIGAVNTVDIRDGVRRGTNTDVPAAFGAVEGAAERAGLPALAECEVLIVGAGGAGRAIAYGLKPHVRRIIVANRTLERARALAAELDVEACGLEQISGLEPDVIVNGTSVGMWPHVDESPVPSALFRPGMVVFDAVYNPVRTKMLADAEAAGAVTAPGIDWFLNQAVAQFETWTGETAPRERMERAARECLGPA
jgi:3-dehydroquinate dehydratase/shikimate dehydrogenase